MKQREKNLTNKAIPNFKEGILLFSIFLLFLFTIPNSHGNSVPILSQDRSSNFEVDLRVSSDNRLNITNPKEGDIISGVITIEWVVEESYVDASTSYQVQFSPDDGDNWIILTMYTLNPSYVWNTTYYEEYNSHCRIQIFFQSKNFDDFSEISGRFTIDNTIQPTPPMDLTPYILVGASIVILGVGVWKYRPFWGQKSILQAIQSEKYVWLTTLSHKIIIGLDNIKSEFIEEFPQIPEVKTISLTTSIADIFPQNLRYDLQHNMKGRTVLTLIEMAYLGPDDTTPTKISKSLNIPLPTLSKEIKKLETAGYVETYLTTQMLQDARVKNFVITKKGFELLLNLDTALKIAIQRMR